jgi:threonine aldolase
MSRPDRSDSDSDSDRHDRHEADAGERPDGSHAPSDGVVRRTFGSDNFAGVHPEVMEAILRANDGHVTSYGDDPITAQAEELVRHHFSSDAVVFLTFNGTGANVVGLQTLLRPWEAVICSAGSHIYVDECGAPERFIGSKLVPIAPLHGKLSPGLVDEAMSGIGDEHRVQPRVLSITESTEVGTCYTIDEIAELADWAHARELRLHLDGARLANAAAWLDVSFSVFSDAGVDVLSFGGTKNGALAAEAVVSFVPGAAEQLRYVRKQSMQLASKMRFVAAQFVALLSGDLWHRNASQANAMARRLADGATTLPGVEIVHPVEANGVFASLPRRAVEVAQRSHTFYSWEKDPESSDREVVRWMTSFDTTQEDVDTFLDVVRDAVGHVENGGRGNRLAGADGHDR